MRHVCWTVCCCKRKVQTVGNTKSLKFNSWLSETLQLLRPNIISFSYVGWGGTTLNQRKARRGAAIPKLPKCSLPSAWLCNQPRNTQNLLRARSRGTNHCASTAVWPKPTLWHVEQHLCHPAATATWILLLRPFIAHRAACVATMHSTDQTATHGRPTRKAAPSRASKLTGASTGLRRRPHHASSTKRAFT